MPISKRHQQILDILKKNETVNVADLSEQLGVSPNTIRNDLDSMAEQGLIIRTHGGATLARQGVPPQLWPLDQTLPPQAEHIIHYALSWVKDGDSLIMDSSLFCIKMAEQMDALRNLRVITTSLPVAFVLSREPSNKVVIAGGEIDHNHLSTRGQLALSAINDFHADKAFITCTGVSGQGLTDQSTESAQLHQAMKKAAESTFVLVESGRVGKTDLFSVGKLADARRIITDSELDSTFVQPLAEAGGRVTVCSANGHQTYRTKFGLGRKARIGFANLSEGIWFSSMVGKSVIQEASKIDGLELLTADNQTNAEKAIQNAQEFIKNEIDLLIEYEGTGLGVRSIRQMMREADIPVIAVDIPIMGATHLGSDHDAVGATAGHTVGRWIQENWDGQLDQVLWLTSEGGATFSETSTLGVRNWQPSLALGESLSPAARFSSAYETLLTYLAHPPAVQQMVLPGGWQTSEDAVRLHYERFMELLPSLLEKKRVAVFCLVCETALGFSQALRDLNCCHQVITTAFGDASPAVLSELSRPDTCLLGIVNLHPEHYGEKIIHTAVRLLKGEAVPPAIFIQHAFLSHKEVHSETIHQIPATIQ
jgi:DeoR/GlpR family transcriptional regulator of sugar metabolism/DNA-binding LacI/PurR family transcriptional regulator